MAGRTRGENPAPARGVLRWGQEERNLLQRLLRLGDTNPNDPEAADPQRMIAEVGYLQGLHDRHPLFRRHAKRNFYQNARRAAAEYTADRALQGARRRDGGESMAIAVHQKLLCYD